MPNTKELDRLCDRCKGTFRGGTVHKCEGGSTYLASPDLRDVFDDEPSQQETE